MPMFARCLAAMLLCLCLSACADRKPQSSPMPKRPDVKSANAPPENPMDKAPGKVEPKTGPVLKDAKKAEVPNDDMPGKDDVPESAKLPKRSAWKKGGKKDTGPSVPATKGPSRVEADKFVPVKVFYGTDRQPLVSVPEPVVDRTWEHFAACVFLFALALTAGMVVRSRPTPWLKRFALGTLFIACMLLMAGFYLAILQSGHPTKTILSYSPNRGELQVGFCEVSIPKSHRMGKLEAPSIFRLEFTEDPNKHIVLQSIEEAPWERFLGEVGKAVKKSPKNDLFVFVHGFNVSFEEAARRTAQIAYDLQFEGAPVFFSWPSQGEFLSYTVDETNAEWAFPDLKVFLSKLAKNSGARTIHLVAHSMGNRVLTRCLKEMRDERTSIRFNEVILAAPDIDADVFKTQIYPAITEVAERVTLYASANDHALQVSKSVHGYSRAGETGLNIVILPKMDTVDVSAVDTSFVGHSYYGDNNSVITDLKTLIELSLPPSRRQFLKSARRAEAEYWVFNP